jgi:hypothetical protein
VFVLRRNASAHHVLFIECFREVFFKYMNIKDRTLQIQFETLLDERPSRRPANMSTEQSPILGEEVVHMVVP